MDRAEAIKRLEDLVKTWDGDPFVQKSVDAFKLAIAALREQEQSKWISVNERLPEEDGSFLVCFKAISSSYMKVVDFTNCYSGLEEHLQGRQIWYFYDSEWGDCELSGVTHWMPLPEPPKEGAEV